MMTRKILLLSLISLVLPPILWSASPTSDILFRHCAAEEGNYEGNSSFENNLKILLRPLPTTTYLTGFHQKATGSSDEEVYGQALCRGDASPSECKSCLQHASQEILRQCKTKEAIIWLNLCQIHYSSTQFFNSMTYAGKYPPYDRQMKNTTLPAKFEKALNSLFDRLSREATYNSSRLKFAAGWAEVSRERIYAMVQCTRDMSSDNCQECLNDALGDLMGCCSTQQGGIIVSRNCDVRFDVKIFYNASAINEVVLSRDGSKTVEALTIAGIVAIILIFLIVSYLLYRRRMKQLQEDEEKTPYALAIHKGVAMTKEGNLVCTDELPFMELDTIRAATADFAHFNKLGQGGFGSIYKGVLPEGKQIAVKRLSIKSRQGFEEFKNEIILIAKLQHVNLVRLLGCGLQGDEKILVYEFMPNRSLDLYVFDREKRAKMNWETRHNIINGISRGLLYLHEDSRLRIIHRDLKPSNILLDGDMVAKISDFGMARIFAENQNTENTRRVVGTYGYMAPEYAMEGLFSVKSDVFSFGVILLEVISGRKNSGFHLSEHNQTLLAYAWGLWNEQKITDFVDELLPEPYCKEEVTKYINIGLLCVQEDPADRPTMSSVVSLLSNESPTLPAPNRPAVPLGRLGNQQSLLNRDSSINDISECTVISPR